MAGKPPIEKSLIDKQEEQDAPPPADTRERELCCRLAVALTRKFAPAHIAALMERFGSLSAAMQAPGATEIKGVTASKLKLVRDALNGGAVDAERAACERSHTRLLLCEDDEYPPLLRAIADPPALIWVRGEMTDDDRLAIAIVGSRGSTHYGNTQAARFAREMAARRMTVVSGLARGVDTAAHTGALAAGGRTIAVVGSGLDELYPPENVRLAADITGAGAVISEFPLKTPAHPRNFPQRNRIISGLSLGVLVVEAGKRSGSLITARLASEQGREVFAIPGKIDTEDSSGCHALIKDGAKLTENIDDILAELHTVADLPSSPVKIALRRNASGTPTELALLKLLMPSDPVNIEEIIARTGLPAAQVAAALLTLEMRGAVKQLPGRNYVQGGS